MKQIDVIKVIAQDLGQDPNSSNVTEINKLLKAKNYKITKYRIAGKAIGHFGFTGVVKSITEEGLKVFEAARVRLIKFSDMESFDRAKPRVERPKRPKADPKLAPKKHAKKSHDQNDEDEDFDEDDFDDDQEGDIFIEEEPAPKKNDKKKKSVKRPSPTGSRFIPGK